MGFSAIGEAIIPVAGPVCNAALGRASYTEAKAMMKRNPWSDIKARTTPDVRARIEAEARLLSEDIGARTAAETATPQAQEDGGDVRNDHDKDTDRH